MAYAALISLQESLNQIMLYPTPKIKTFTSFLFRFRPSVDHNQREQIRFLLPKLEYLLEFLEDPSQKIDERTCSLVTRIRDAAYEAQNIADLYCYEKEMATIRHVPMPDLQKIIKKIDDIESDIRKQAGSTMEKAKNIESRLVPNDDLQLYKSFRADSSKDAPEKTLVGFDERYVQIMDELMGRESALRVVSITGMGGIGKTTLARNIYDDASIKCHFDICAWVVISQSYSIRGILLGILDSMKMLSDEMFREGEDELRLRLIRSLKARRYLITIDDIWDTSVWDEIRWLFPNDDNRSRILLTTRLADVAAYVSSSGSCLRLSLLSMDQSWSLLCSKVFGDKEYCPLELEQIVRKISQRCEGHPLSLAVMGGLLSRIDKTKEAWLDVEQNVISTMASDNDFAPACLGILKLSYDYLPQWLKPCFLYMAHFQEDEEISVSKLIKLWVAEGFLKQETHQNSEATAEKCLKELVYRNMIIVSKQKVEGKIKTCRIHDLLLDLCRREADREKFLCVMFQKTSHNHLRLSIHSETPDLILSDPISSFKFVRSLLYTGSTDHLSLSVFLKFKLLRVVDALKVAFPNFPHELLKLLNLTYISFTCQAHIPASISNLRNLQTLIIHQENTANLPVEIWNMTHLRHVEFEKGSLPYPIGTQLGTDGNPLVLMNLRTLSGIRNLRFTEDVLARIPSIETLKIFYDTLHGGKGRSYYEFQNLVNLKLLRALKIYVNIDIHKMRHLTGSELEFQFPPSLKELTLSGCLIPWEDLSVVGSLPSLEVLKLRHGSCIGDHWSPNEGDFPRLKLLLLQSLNLVHWELEHDDLFPILELLILRDCYALREIPYQIREIPTFTKIELDKSNESLLVSAMELEEWQRDMGNDDFQVIIHTAKKSSSDSLFYPWDKGQSKIKESNAQAFEDVDSIFESTREWRTPGLAPTGSPAAGSVSFGLDKKSSMISRRPSEPKKRSSFPWEREPIRMPPKRSRVKVKVLTEILRGVYKIKERINPPIAESTGETNKAPRSPLVVEASTHESSMVGFNEHFPRIKNWLTESKHERLQVMKIVGMAGIGKTTLARNLFEQAATDYKFKIHVWVSVSRTNDVQTMIRAILDSIRPKEDELDDKSIQQLTGILHQSLKGKSYLIVLDDVWDIQLWDDIKTSFPDDYTRSRIILTTRLTEMDFEDQLCTTHRMMLLTSNNSWTLFCMKVFGEETCPQELEYDAKHILGNCGGLPLAIVVIGGLLSKVSRNKDDWQLIASSTNSMVTSTEELKEILSLGYKYLPLHLRACFRSMIIFLVEDYELAVPRLVRLWIDEGLVDQLGSKSFEEVADEYLKDLIDRGLVMVCKQNENGDAETCGISSIWKDYVMAENPDILQILLSKSNQSTTPKEGMEDLPRSYSEGVSMKVEEEQKGEIKLAKSLDISMDILFNNRYTKDCIRYCSLFPTTFEFTKDVLVSLWIAQGWTIAGNDAFIEEACIQCFDILLKVRYIVPTGYDPHGDKIKYKVGEEMYAFLQDHLIRPQFSKELDGTYIEDSKLEHVSLSFKDIGQINFEIIKKLNSLQSLIIHGCYGFKVTHLPFDLFRELKSLRILSISHTDVVELPSSIECSKELRYLDMSETSIRWLPESMCNLSNLQTLDLDNCLGLIRLPKRMKQLINLRHLILDVARQLQSMPEGIGNLSELRTLRAFLVGEEDGYTINELKHMNKLSGSLRILKLENIKTPEQAADASLCRKQDLKKIELQWSDFEDEMNQDEEEILTRLEPPLGIQELKILYYSGGKLPSWIGKPSFSKMVSITLHKCRYCTSLPFLGQLPSLKFLNIIGMNVVQDINSLFCGEQGNDQHQHSFPVLEKLTLDSMSELEKWTTEIRIGDFPCLMKLTIESCPKINCLPSLSNLKSLMHMEISYCTELSCLPDGRLPSTLESLMIRDCPKLNERCSNNQGEDWSKIAQVPAFYIDNMEVHTK